MLRAIFAGTSQAGRGPGEFYYSIHSQNEAQEKKRMAADSFDLHVRRIAPPRPCVGEPYATRSIEATRPANSLPMTDFLNPWSPPSIRGPFAEVAHEAPYHQRGWQVARRNRARSRPFCCQESRYSYGPPCTLLPRDSSKKSVSHFDFGEIINDRCTNITTRHPVAVFEDREPRHDCSTVAHSLPSR